jgi:CxxC-x17-CxxC domain-containing protein
MKPVAGVSQQAEGPLRGMAFIDLPNITSGGQAFGSKRINFWGLSKVLTENTRNVGVHAYVADRGDRQELFREMGRIGITVIPVSPGKSVDGRLIFDMIVGAQRDNYDIAVLASGDRDYVPVVQEVKRLKKTVWVASFSSAFASSLKAAADLPIDLDQRTSEIMFEMTLYDAICTDCGKPIKVPFKPINDKPVYCREDLVKHRM